MAESHPGTGNSPVDPQFVTELTAQQGTLHAYLVSLLPGDPDIDDILQKTNLVLWEKRSDYEPGTNFKAWALSIAYWEARAWLTSRKRKSWLVFDENLANTLAERIARSPDRSPNASLSALRHCLGKLRENDRLLVLNHYQHEKSLAECSRIFSRSRDSLKVSLFRIRGLLRQCIKSQVAIERATS